MLGQVRRTTRTDVGLALASAGLAYLVWAIVIGVARHVVNELELIRQTHEGGFPGLTTALCASVVQGAAVWDMVGVLWLMLNLVLIVGSSRQRWIISWPWLSAMLHALAAALIGCWTALAGINPFGVLLAGEPAAVGWGSYSVALALALLMWVLTLVWLLYERSRLRRGPTLQDGQRTHRP